MNRSTGFFSTGFFHWVLPAMVGVLALTTLLSGRDLSQNYTDLHASVEVVRHPIIPWVQRIVSLLLVAAAMERVLSHITQHRHLPAPVLTWALVFYWLSTVAAPAVFGSHPHLSHEYLYTLMLGFAGVLASAQERDKIIGASRDALFLFMLAGVVLIPVMPTLVLDASYTQGLLPGIPRLGGLAPHPVALGMFAQIALLLLWYRPFKRRWFNFAAWVLGLSVLFFAQSKTAWTAFILCSIAMLAVRHGPNLWRRLGDPKEGAFGIVVCVGVMLAAAGLMVLVLVVDVGTHLTDFMDTAEGAQLVSLTGRDQIWAVAIEEWQSNRLFGYGPLLWDWDYRSSIGMMNATSAHNQFMDTLARAGTVGATGLVLYALVLLVLSVRYARASGGLSLALFLAIALRSVSEVPLLLLGYGTELVTHLLLIVTLASSASARVQVEPARARTPYRTAS